MAFDSNGYIQKDFRLQSTMTEEPKEKSTQVTLKIPSSFLTDFDLVTEQLGYPRNEAIREAMRRFLDWGYQKVNERHPERQMGLVQGMFGSIFGGLMEEAKKLEQSETLPVKPEHRQLEDAKPKAMRDKS